MKFLLCLIGVSLSLLLSAHPAQATQPNDLVGDWVLPDGYGEIGTPRLDVKNPSKSARHRLIMGLEITSELRFEGYDRPRGFRTTGLL